MSPTITTTALVADSRHFVPNDFYDLKIKNWSNNFEVTADHYSELEEK